MTTKRTMGQCTCDPAEWQRHETHQPDCPALYPLQRQPGDEKDALTQLVAHVRIAWMLGPNATNRLDADEWQSTALDLISEAREDLRKARDIVASVAGGVDSDLLKNSRDRFATLAGQMIPLQEELAKVKVDLLATQKRMGEVRQQAFREAKAELAENILLLGDAGPVTTENLQRLLEHYRDNFEGKE